MAAKESFERANPSVTIIIEQYKDYFEMINELKIEDVNAADIIEIGGFPVGNTDGIFIDLKPFIAEKEGLEEDLYSGLLRVVRNSGMLPGLPIEVSPPLIIYNKEIFDQAGLSYPTEDWTWDDMVDLAKQLTQDISIALLQLRHLAKLSMRSAYTTSFGSLENISMQTKNMMRVR